MRFFTDDYPAYNERANIERTIEQSIAALRPRFDRFEIVVVLDGPTDGTDALAVKLAHEHEEITLLRNPHNMGVGPTLKRGLEAARYGLVVHNGMDYPFALTDLDRMLPELARADVVVAARTGYAGYTAWRRIVSALNRGLLRLFFDVPASDCNFTQLYRRDVLHRVRVGSTAAGFIMPETIIRARDLGFRVIEVPIEYHARQTGRSVLGRPKVLWHSLSDMLRFWWRRSVSPGDLHVAPHRERH
jgi:glycosyltransferase involved in cell wall biosynthesis